ncbi:MAG: ABC transporter permease [Oscillospiraceae bacterium]|jgi:oligopeptide transport system permease protein|nr:ABC transporter permease [Oscillospiraceae bacterium]
MGKYLLKRVLFSLFSIVAVVAIVMVLIYSVMNRDLVFAKDTVFQRQASNGRITYQYQKWEEYGYIDYVPYTEWLIELAESGEIDEETRAAAASFGRTPDNDSDTVKELAARFVETYEAKGYTVVRKDAVMNGRKLANGGAQIFFAWGNQPLLDRLVGYFSRLIDVDSIHYAQGDVGERGITFTAFDPVYGGEKFSPAIIGNGTKHKYLLYFDSQFPFLHQNIATINLGQSYTVNKGTDVFLSMTRSQGSYVLSETTFPSGLVEQSADDLHTAIYNQGSRESTDFLAARYADDYTSVDTARRSPSKIGFSFIIGIISTICSYLLGVPLGIMMARKKDKLMDKLGTAYIIFIIAVPSLAYIFMFRAIGGQLGLPMNFDMESDNNLMYVLPIISLALPSVANLMKWLRRYMIDQMNSDYVKFARSGGLTEGEIFTKHILKNAAIPIFHGIPGSILFAMTGAIITERIYSVPGAGGLLTEAINKYDNGVIVGVTLFYAVLSVVAIILGDVVMATVDPRISFSTKDR